MTLFTASLSLCAGQEPAAPAAGNDPEKKKGKIEGTVTHGLSKEIIRRAEVTLMPVNVKGFIQMGPDGPPGTRRTTSDAEGKYVFTDVEPGRYQLAAQKSGFIRGVYNAGGRPPGKGASMMFAMGTQLELAAGQVVSNAKIEMTPQGVITGRVVDEEGEPIQNLSVSTMHSTMMQGKRRMMPMGNAQTNDRGEFRLINLMPGEVILQVSPQRWGGTPTGATDKQPDKAYVNTFYPGVTEMAQAARIEITPGAELSGYEIRLQKARVSRIKGKVLDQAGAPAKNLMVMLMPRDSGLFSPLGQGGTQADGKFELLNVPPGNYTLMIQGPGTPGYREPVTVAEEPGEDLVIRMRSPFTVEGQFVTKPDAKIDLAGIQVQLTDEDGIGWGAMPQLKLGTDGHFTLDKVVPGTYKVQVYMNSTDGGYPSSIRYGDHDATSQSVPITAAGTSLKVFLDDAAGTVSGQAMDKEVATPGVMVVLLHTDKSRRGMFNTKISPTDQNGRFTIKNVVPGDYLAFALEGVEFGAWEDEEVFKKLERKATKVTVTRGGTETVQLTATGIPQ
ncbi:MAG: carboxypeptidase regulatory-like domain-containing protein [Acidobacteria bacterium]|nr:carboxypeptidase regulatory-like domain-containing protein [Acidobacteriota bacterium]